jgi:hypothetical protein
MLNEHRPQKLNVDRMRRHMARDTPDRIVVQFDAVKLETRQIDLIVNYTLHEFIKRMRIKHRGDVDVTSYVAEELNFYPGMRTIVLVARKSNG